MSWDRNVFSWPTFSPTPEDTSQPSTLTDSSTSPKSPPGEAPYDENILSLTPSQDPADSDDSEGWELRLSDSSDEYPEEVPLDHERFSDEVPSDQSLSISPNDATPPESTPESEPEPGSSQEQSSIESRDGESWSQDGDCDRYSQERSCRGVYENQDYGERIGEYGNEEHIDDEAGYLVQEPDEEPDDRRYSRRKRKRSHGSDPERDLAAAFQDRQGRFVYQELSSRRGSPSVEAPIDNEQKIRKHRRRSLRRDSSEMEAENEQWQGNPRKKRKTPKKERVANDQSYETTRKKKRRFSELDSPSYGSPETSDRRDIELGSFDEGMAQEKRFGRKRKLSAKSPPLERFAYEDTGLEEELGLSLEDEDLEDANQEEQFVILPTRKRRRYTDERLREINENWNRMYDVDDPSKIGDDWLAQSPDSAALNVRFALEECLADIEGTITRRIPRALQNIESKERLNRFHDDVGKDLTAIYNAVECKAVAHIQKLKENCERLAELDKILMPAESMQFTVEQLRAAANDTVSSIERLRSKKEHSAVQQSLLRSHLKLYQKVLEEHNAQVERHGAELAELEKECAQLEEVINKAIKLRQEDKESTLLSEGLQSALETKSVLQKELQSIRERIQQQEEIISFPDSLKVEKLLAALRATAAELLSTRGFSMSHDLTAEVFKQESSSRVPDTQESIERLTQLFESFPRTTASTQTILAMQHFRELESSLETSDEPQDSSATEKNQATDGSRQSANEADSSGTLD